MEIAVGRCLGSRLIAKPNRKSCITGTPTIIAERDAVAAHLHEFLDQYRAQRARRRIARSSRVLLKMDEDVFEAGRGFVDRRCALLPR